MFGIGFPELILILALALIVVGPDKLPDLARSIAKTLVDLKKTAEGLKDSLNEEDNPLSEIKPALEDAAKNFKETVLDAETKTWKTPEDLAELNKANGVTDAYEEWNRDDIQKPAENADTTPKIITDEDVSPEASPSPQDESTEQPPKDTE